jgi:chaperonin GroEL (HSP60 family)
MDLRRGTQLAVDHVVAELNKISKAVTSKSEVSQVRGPTKLPEIRLRLLLFSSSISRSVGPGA